MQSISYCNDTLDTKPLQDLKNDLQKAAHIGVGLLILLAALFLLFNVLREWYSWRCLQQHVASTREAFVMSHGDEKHGDVLEDHSLMSLLQLSTHPLLAEGGLKMAMRMGIRSTEGKNRIRWWLAWISHPVVIVLLIMGLVGLLSVEVQLAAVDKIGKHYQGRFQNMADQSASGVQDRIDAALQGMSTDYANKSNAVLQLAQDDLNDHLFRWVNTTTSTMNNTLNEFMDGIATVINETFSNTPLFTPVQSFIDCIIGQKVKGIEDGLTWMQSNAHVSFPIVPDNILMVSPNATQEVMQPLTNSTLGSEGILADIIGSYEHTLEKERIMFIILLLLYLLLFLVGTLIAITRGSHSLLRRRSTGEGKYDDQVSPFDGFVTTAYNRSDSPGIAASHRSISKPLHPDVVSLYQQQASPSPPSATDPFVVAKSTSRGCSWESLLDTCDSSMQEQRQGLKSSTMTKQAWLQKLPSYRTSSADSAYDPAARGLQQDADADGGTSDQRILSFWLWKSKEDTHGPLQQDHDSLRRQSIPIVSSPTRSKNELPMYPASCESGHESGSFYSEHSRDSRGSKRQSFGHKQDVDSSRRALPLSYISERPESDQDSLELGTQRNSKPSPQISFGLQDQADEVPLHRHGREFTLTPGRAL